MQTTAIYASLLAALFVLLSARVIAVRQRAQVALGDGGDPVLARRIRVHGNFAEFVPLALILIGLAESMGAATIVLHGLGLALLVARLSHAWGVSQENEVLAFRIVGVMMTFGVLLLGAGTCLVMAFR